MPFVVQMKYHPSGSHIAVICAKEKRLFFLSGQPEEQFHVYGYINLPHAPTCLTWSVMLTTSPSLTHVCLSRFRSCLHTFVYASVCPFLFAVGCDVLGVVCIISLRGAAARLCQCVLCLCSCLWPSPMVTSIDMCPLNPTVRSKMSRWNSTQSLCRYTSHLITSHYITSRCISSVLRCTSLLITKQFVNTIM